MTTPKLYCALVSPSSRGTLLTIKALGIDVELTPVDMPAGEHRTHGYIKLNPLGTVPTLQDGDFVLGDSHAINCYLADKYGKDDSLYPKNLEKRAIVHQRLHFDTGILFPRSDNILLSLVRDGAKTIAKDKADLLSQAYTMLETLLEKTVYIAGEQLTIADFSIISTLTSANVFVPIASNRFPKISEYISRMQALPYYVEINQVGVERYAGMVKSKLT